MKYSEKEKAEDQRRVKLVSEYLDYALEYSRYLTGTCNGVDVERIDYVHDRLNDLRQQLGMNRVAWN